MRSFLAAVAFGAAAVQAKDSPVTRVVNLLKELQARIETDADVEQKAYDKFACWCETTSKRKAESIHKAKADLKMHGTTILEKKGLVATRTAEITKLTKDIKEAEEAMAKATSLRQKENE